MTTITNEQIDAIVSFLERIDMPGFKPGELVFTPGCLPSYNPNETVSELIQALYKNGWVTPAFDWTEWQDEAIKYLEVPDKVQCADVQTIQKLLTTHARKDRFCDGHFAAMIENGHIQSLLRRLLELRKTET